jgi:hypothetical protein
VNTSSTLSLVLFYIGLEESISSDNFIGTYNETMDIYNVGNGVENKSIVPTI